MSDKRKWWTILGTGALVAIAVGGLIYWQQTKLEEDRLTMSNLEVEIQKGRAIVATTPELEKQVITHRETDATVAEILPDRENVNNFVRTLRDFEEASGVKINSLKEKPQSDRQKLEFDRVAYTLHFDADGFQMLSFLNEIERHSRFMSVTSFKLSAARRTTREGDSLPRHKVTMDVETYVYEPKDGGSPVKVENYDRKRDLLMAEITRRRSDLRIDTFDYRGPRGRRDPWIDPRVPAGDGTELVLSIEDQITMVDELVARSRELAGKWNEVTVAPNLIAKMKARADFDHNMATLEEEIRRIQDQGQLVFIPAERRFHTEVAMVVDELRRQIDGDRSGVGPSVVELRETLAAMDRHFEQGEFELSLQAYRTVETALESVAEDDVRGPLVTKLREKSEIAHGVLDFNRIELEINGVAIHEGVSPVAIINGRTVSVGEMLTDADVIVQAIRRDEIEFGFRGLTLIRRIQP